MNNFVNNSGIEVDNPLFTISPHDIDRLFTELFTPPPSWSAGKRLEVTATMHHLAIKAALLGWGDQSRGYHRSMRSIGLGRSPACRLSRQAYWQGRELWLRAHERTAQVALLEPADLTQMDPPEESP